MAAAKPKGPQVSAILDEDAGKVIVGVVVGDQFLPVAETSLDYAKARAISADGSSQDDDDTEGGS